MFFVVYQLSWMVLLAVSGFLWCAVGAACLAGCVLYVAFFYGDHAGRVAFIFDTRTKPAVALARQEVRGL